MNLTTILLILIFIIPIIIGIVFLRFSKKLALAFISIPFLFMLGVAGWWIYEANHRFTSSTDLEGEQIDDLELYVVANDEFKNDHGEYETSDNVKYREHMEFDTFSVGTNFEENEIVYIEANERGMTTTKNIEVDDSVEDVIDEYGEDYYKSSEMGEGETINYVDRDTGIHLQFWLANDLVEQIAIYTL